MRGILLVFLVACAGGTGDGDAPPEPVGWSGTVTLDADHVVAAGDQLVIAAGTTVELAAGVSIVVHGELVAIGTEEEPITFTGVGWGSILFEDDSVDATFEDLDDYVGGSTLQHVVVEGGTRAVKLMGASPYLADGLYRGNVIPPELDLDGGAALYMGAGSAPRVRGNTFEDNVAELFGYGGAIFAIDAAPVLQDNLFLRNRSTYGGAISTERVASPMVGNHFEGNSAFTEGGGVSLVSSIPAVLDNTFVGNTSAGDGGGLHVCVTCYPHAAPFVMDNVVTDNVATGEGAGGVGAAFLRAFADNDVYGNTSVGEPADFGWFHPRSEGYPAWAEDVDIGGNWWGSTEAPFLDATVHDQADDPSVGRASWDPPLSGPGAAPRTRVTLTSLKQVYVDEGDEMPVYLTVYNPGPERSVVLTVLRDEGGESVPVVVDLDFPGAEPQGDGWALVLPEDSVWYTVLLTETYPGGLDGLEGTWVASLTDEGGDVVAASTSRYAYASP